jgi:hypothetical protein
MLEFPACEICHFLFELGVDESLINEYHRGRKNFNDLPEFARIALDDKGFLEGNWP